MLGIGGIYIELEEGKSEGVGQSGTRNERRLASADETTRRRNPDEHHILTVVETSNLTCI
jgi:hypothetical protein